MSASLSLDNIRLKYLHRDNGTSLLVLDGISLSVAAGSFVSIVGLNGSGKSSLLRIVAGLEQPSSGSVLINGRHVKPSEGKIGLVTQESCLLPWRTVRGNIEIGLEIQKYPRKKSYRIAGEYMHHFGLENYADKYPQELSGGMRQKVAIARSLATSPELVLMDEPFSALDCQSRNKMQTFLLDVWSERKDTVLFVTHSIDEAVYMSDKIVVISKKPAYVQDIVPVNLEHPRDRTNPIFNSIRRHVLDQLQ